LNPGQGDGVPVEDGDPRRITCRNPALTRRAAELADAGLIGDRIQISGVRTLPCRA